MALRQRLCQGSADGHVHGDEARRRKVGIEVGEQFEIQATVGGEIEVARAGKLNGAVSGEVSSLSDKVQLLDLHGLAGEGEANRVLVTDLSVFDFDGEGSQRTVEDPQFGLAEWTTQIERTGNGRMSCELTGENGAPHGVEIELIHLKREVRGIA